jgi:hypothetical protein
MEYQVYQFRLGCKCEMGRLSFTISARGNRIDRLIYVKEGMLTLEKGGTIKQIFLAAILALISYSPSFVGQQAVMA